MQYNGGGNCANALTGMSRLGMNAHLVTKIGDDAFAGQILEELQRDKVCTDHVLQEPGHTSPFTYIIIDRQGASSALAWPALHPH